MSCAAMPPDQSSAALRISPSVLTSASVADTIDAGHWSTPGGIVASGANPRATPEGRGVGEGVRAASGLADGPGDAEGTRAHSAAAAPPSLPAGAGDACARTAPG